MKAWRKGFIRSLDALIRFNYQVGSVRILGRGGEGRGAIGCIAVETFKGERVCDSY
jgi:hypothetical protein